MYPMGTKIIFKTGLKNNSYEGFLIKACLSSVTFDI